MTALPIASVLEEFDGSRIDNSSFGGWRLGGRPAIENGKSTFARSVPGVTTDLKVCFQLARAVQP
jgi:hypothetical protein